MISDIVPIMGSISIIYLKRNRECQVEEVIACDVVNPMVVLKHDIW